MLLFALYRNTAIIPHLSLVSFYRGFKMMYRTLALLFSLLLPAAAQAASFDCSRAGTNVERLICQDADLSQTDEWMGEVYQFVRSTVKEPETIRQAQKQWLRERNRCADAACLRVAYAQRLRALAANTTSVKPASLRKKGPLYRFCVSPYCIGQTGEGYTVCEAYLKFLNTLSEHPKCRAPIPPGFGRPEETELDVTQHLEWAYQIEMAQLVENKPSFEDWKRVFLERMAQGKVLPRMFTTMLYPSGHKEVTLVGYTGDRLGCLRRTDPDFKGYQWLYPGYFYYVMEGDSGRIQEIDGGIGSPSGMNSELLLVNNHPVFVSPTSESRYSRSGAPDVALLKIDFDGPLTRETEYNYWSETRCQFAPLND